MCMGSREGEGLAHEGAVCAAVGEGKEEGACGSCSLAGDSYSQGAGDRRAVAAGERKGAGGENAAETDPALCAPAGQTGRGGVQRATGAGADLSEIDRDKSRGEKRKKCRNKPKPGATQDRSPPTEPRAVS